MEIIDYWRGLGRRRWLLLTAPLVAAGAAVGFGLQQPAAHEAVTTVQVPVANGDGPVVVRRKVADFESLMQSDAVIKRVGDSTHLSSSTINSAMSISQVSDGSTVEVTVVGPPSINPSAVGASLAQTTVLLSMGADQKSIDTRLDQTKALVTGAEKEADDAQAALNSFISATGHPSPAERYTSVRDQANQTTAQLAVARQHGWQDVAGQLESRLASLNQQITDLGAQANKFNAQLAALTADREQKQEALAAAQRAYVAAQAAGLQAPPVGGIVATSEKTVSRVTSLEQLGVGGGLVGLVLAAIALAIAAPRSRRVGRHAQAADAEADPGEIDMDLANLLEQGSGRSVR